jgi:hypothetical protein
MPRRVPSSNDRREATTRAQPQPAAADGAQGHDVIDLTPSQALESLSDDAVELLAALKGKTRAQIQTALQLIPFGDRAALEAADIVVPGRKLKADVHQLVVTDFCLRVVEEAAAQARRWRRREQPAYVVNVADGEFQLSDVEPNAIFDGDFEVVQDSAGWRAAGSARAHRDAAAVAPEATRFRVIQSGHGRSRLEVDMPAEESSELVSAIEHAQQVEVSLQVSPT